MFGTKKRAIFIGMMLVLTTFVGIAANVHAQELVANAGGPYIADECAVIFFDASGSTGGEGALQYRWDFNNDGTYDTAWSYTATAEWQWFEAYSGSITVEVSDGFSSVTDTTTVTIHNTPPFLENGDSSIIQTPSVVYTNEEVSLDVTFFDGLGRVASTDTYTATINWGDGFSSPSLSLGVYDFEFLESHAYTESGTYNVIITIIDNHEGRLDYPWSITVLGSEIFTVDAGPDGFISEGSTFTSIGSFVSSESGVFTATIDYGDGSGLQPLILNPDNTFALSHQYLDNGDYTIVVTIIRDDVTSVSDSAYVTVANVPPTIISLSATDPTPFGTMCTLSGTFTDPGILDDQTAVIDWGDGSQITTVNFPADNSGSYAINEHHLYAGADDYQIMVTVTDDDGGSDSGSVPVTVVGSEVLTVDAGPDAVINEGSSFVSAGSFTDSVEGIFSGIVDFGGGSGPQALPLNPDHTFALNHQYQENGIYAVLVTIDRDNVVSASDSASVTVNNVPPTATLSNNGPKDEGSPVTIAFSNQYDPGTFDTFSYSFDWNNDGTYDVVNQAGASATHTWYDNGVYTVKGRIMDDDGGFTEYTTLVTVNNVAPTAVLGNDGPKDEGSVVAVSFSGQYDPGTSDTFTYSFDWNNDGTYEVMNQASPSATFTWYDDGVYTVNGMIKDDDGGFNVYTTTVTINNVAPTALMINDGPKNEGSLVAVSFTNQYDPGVADTFSYSFDWNNDGTYDVVNQLGASATHTWYDNGIYTVKGRIMDDDGGFTEYTTVVTVSNVAPTAVLGNDGPKDEGSLVTVSFSGQYDPGTSDTFTYSFDWNNDGTYEISNQASATMTHTWSDNGAYTVKGKIQDDDGGFNVYTTIVTVLNVPPTITSLSGPPTDPILLGTSITLNGVFTDPGTLDTHVAVITWDDGSSNTVNLAAGVYQVSKSHTYTSVGVYVITLTVTDKDGGSDTKTIESYIVVFNPSGGFVTGGGWLISPAGSYPADPTLTGRVNFGFVCKYKKGQAIPDGETEFQFQLANINFHSDGYEWLIVVGPKATYQGYGTVNGQGHYGFKITVIDGKQSGGGGVDKFRMKIWDKDNNDQVIYDTDCGAPDTQNPSVALSGGQITIHKA